MSVQFSGNTGNTVGKKTAAANTPWYAVVPGQTNLVTRLLGLQVKSAGATVNGIYVMRPLGYATVETAQAATDTTLVLDRDPSSSGNTIANLDQVLYEASDGTTRQVQVSAWTAATLTLTVAALPAAVSAGALMFFMGVYTDTEPDTSLAFPLIDTPASATTTYDWSGWGGFATWNTSEPILLYCPNATDVTTLNYAGFARTTG